VDTKGSCFLSVHYGMWMAMYKALDRAPFVLIYGTFNLKRRSPMSVVPEKPLYSLDLKGEGISISRKIEESKAKAILDVVFGDVPTDILTATKMETPTRPSGRARLSLREVLDEANATSNAEKIVVIGSYVTGHENAADFSRDDAKNRFKAAGESSPANIHRDFAAAIQNGWIAEDPKKPGRFYVTQKGHTAIAQKFSVRVSAKTATRKSAA
jgi:hypothetical protein